MATKTKAPAKKVSGKAAAGAAKTIGRGVLSTALKAAAPKATVGTAAVEQPIAAYDPTLLTDDQWADQDSTYLQTQAALNQALQNYGNGIDAQRTQYDIDNDQAIQKLGFQGGQWNRTDVNTQSGRAFNDQQNDFASRGMLQSSGYAQSDENLSRTLNDQLTANQNARTSYMQGKSADMLDQANQTGQATIDAKAAAIARRAQQAAAAAGRLT